MHTHFDKMKEQTVTLVDEKFDIPKSKVDENYKNKSGVENSGGSNDDTFTENSVSLSANKVSNNDNLNNEFTGSNNDIVKTMVSENDDENIGSDNEMLECIESELSLIHI